MKQWIVAWRRISKELHAKGLRSLLSAIERNDPNLAPGVFALTNGRCCAFGWACKYGDDEMENYERIPSLFNKLCRETPIGEPSPVAFTHYFDDMAGGETRLPFFKEFRIEVMRSIIVNENPGADMTDWFEKENDKLWNQKPIDILRTVGMEPIETMFTQMTYSCV